MQKIEFNWVLFLICLTLCTMILLYIEFDKQKKQMHDKFNTQQADIDELFLRTDELFKKQKERGNAL